MAPNRMRLCSPRRPTPDAGRSATDYGILLPCLCIHILPLGPSSADSSCSFSLGLSVSNISNSSSTGGRSVLSRYIQSNSGSAPRPFPLPPPVAGAPFLTVPYSIRSVSAVFSSPLVISPTSSSLGYCSPSTYIYTYRFVSHMRIQVDLCSSCLLWQTDFLCCTSTCMVSHSMIQGFPITLCRCRAASARCSTWHRLGHIHRVNVTHLGGNTCRASVCVF